MQLVNDCGLQNESVSQYVKRFHVFEQLKKGMSNLSASCHGVSDDVCYRQVQVEICGA